MNMSFCRQCGFLLQEDSNFCPKCGTIILPAAESSHAPPPYQDPDPASYHYRQQAGAFEPSKDTGMAVLAYLNILVLIPLFAGGDSDYVHFHTGQGLLLCIASMVFHFALRFLRVFTWGIFRRAFGFVDWAMGLGFFILAVIGIINATRGDKKELPIIGQFAFFK